VLILMSQTDIRSYRAPASEPINNNILEREQGSSGQSWGRYRTRGKVFAEKSVLVGGNFESIR
jgi:hypothetical protein